MVKKSAIHARFTEKFLLEIKKELVVTPEACVRVAAAAFSGNVRRRWRRGNRRGRRRRRDGGGRGKLVTADITDPVIAALTNVF